jgi:AraC family transcriptional regulator
MVRDRIFDAGFATVDNLQRTGDRRDPPSKGFSPDYQVCLPYRGVFVWHVAGDEVVGDANQVLFVSGGEPFHLTEPVPGGYGELIVTPSVALLSDLADTTEMRLARHPLFLRRTRHANARLQNLRARFLHQATDGNGDVLAVEEQLIELLRGALRADTPRWAPNTTTRRLIGAAKLFVDAHCSRAIRLDDVARAVGSSPAYLTDLFRRVEGIPLHKYLVQLRLARALVELPHADDLTQLALRLGFSSHSHFAAAFRGAFHCTPSQFRTSTRLVQRQHASPAAAMRRVG